MPQKVLSRVQLLVTPWTAAYQAPPSVGFSRQEYWSGLPLPSPIYLIKSHHKHINVDLPGGSGVKNPPATGAHSLSWGAPLWEMATHSNILAWKIPRIEEPGRL